MKDANRHSTGEAGQRKSKANQPTPMVSFKEACRCYLTDTEIEMLKYISKGFTCKEISAKTGNKPSTIQTHRRNIKKKLNLRGYRTLERWCREHKNAILQYSL